MALTPIFEELCQEYQEAGAAHPLADLETDEAHDEAQALGGRELAEQEPADAAEPDTGWVMPDERVA